MLLEALYVFEQHHLLDVWEDGRIRVGSDWNDEITQAIGTSHVAILLITRESLESKYIINSEFPFLRERQQRNGLIIIPVICEPCDWRSHRWLQKRHCPNQAKPLSELLANDRKGFFQKLATEIAEELSQICFEEFSEMDRSNSPACIYLDKFPLTRNSSQRKKNLFGREQELALLDLAFVQQQTAIVSLVAWGGVGKTMLVQHWLQRLQHENWCGARRVYAWSFYSQGTMEDRHASEDTFLAHALEWFGVQCQPTLSAWDKGRLLADTIARERILLILDGVEPLQYPPGPMAGQLRAPGVQSLLKRLARVATNTDNHALCVVTTREALTDLVEFERRPDAARGSTLRVRLNNLSAQAGAALLHHAGAKRVGAVEIQIDDPELLAASREVDGHALTLNLLGCFLARAYMGDIRQRASVNFEKADARIQGGHAFKMLTTYERWLAAGGPLHGRQLSILRILSLFDRPADNEYLRSLRQKPVITGLTESLIALDDTEWNIALTELSDCDLVSIQFETHRSISSLYSVDAHPLIREYFASCLRKSNKRAWCAAHIRLYKHLQKSAANLPDSLQAIQPLCQAISSGCQAGLHARVFNDIYWKRVLRGSEAYIVHKLGAFGITLELSAAFFTKPWDRISAALSNTAQSELLNDAAYCLRALGRLKEALRPMQMSVNLCRKKLKDWQRAAISANNLGELKLLLGDIGGAIRDCRGSVALANRSRSAFQQSVNRAAFADALHQRDAHAEALSLFRDAEAIRAKAFPTAPLLKSVRGFQYCDLLLSKAEIKAWQVFNSFVLSEHSSLTSKCDVASHMSQCTEVERRANLILNRIESEDWPIDVALERLTLARALLYTAVFNRSLGRPGTYISKIVSLVTSAVTGLRRAGDATHIPRGLLTRAWLHCLTRNSAAAAADLDDAWDIAERGPMPLHMADIHLHRARLFFRKKYYPWTSPTDDIVLAEALINECGYHRRDRELTDAKRVIIEPKR